MPMPDFAVPYAAPMPASRDILLVVCQHAVDSNAGESGSLGSGGRGRPYSQRSWRRQCRPARQKGLLATGIDDAPLNAGAGRRWRGAPSRPGDDPGDALNNGALTMPMKGANLGLNSDSAILVDSWEIRFFEGIIRKPQRNGVDAQRRQGLGDCCGSQWRAAKPTVVSGIDARQTGSMHGPVAGGELATPAKSSHASARANQPLGRSGHVNLHVRPEGIPQRSLIVRHGSCSRVPLSRWRMRAASFVPHPARVCLCLCLPCLPGSAAPIMSAL